MVVSSECLECSAKPYNYSQSNTYKPGKSDQTEILIGDEKNVQLKLLGSTAVDTICLGDHKPNNSANASSDEQYCIEDYEFFVIKSMNTDVFFDDIIGGELGLGMDLPENGLSIISAMKKSGIID